MVQALKAEAAAEIMFRAQALREAAAAASFPPAAAFDPPPSLSDCEPASAKTQPDARRGQSMDLARAPPGRRNSCPSCVCNCAPAAPAAAGASVCGLPPPGAARSSQASSTVSETDMFAEKHADVAIVFADVVGFTQLCATSETEAVMRMLHGLFSRLDEVCEPCGLYKVETSAQCCQSSAFLPARLTRQLPLCSDPVGDAYMACGGLFAQDPASPASDPSSAEAAHGHAHAALLFALLSQSAAAQSGVQLRIGIHTGPVTSGLIGAVRARFCLFGANGNVDGLFVDVLMFL